METEDASGRRKSLHKHKKRKHRDRATRKKANDAAFDQPPPPINESPLVDPPVKKKKTRGNSVNLKLQRLQSGEKLPLEWDMYDCPIGEHANTLSTQCGIVVKLSENCPLQKASFLHIDRDKRSRLVDLVMERFDSERTKRRDQFVLTKLCKKYNDYKSFLKSSIFDKQKTYAERIANRPTDIAREDWKWLVKYWTFDKKFKDRSVQNRANSSCLTLRHATGSKSYARRREEWRKEKGKDPSRLELFEITHNRKDEASSSVLDTFEWTKSQVVNSDETIDDETIYNLQFPEKRPGRMHGMGPIVKPSQLGFVKGASSSWLRHQHEQQDIINGLKGEVSELQSKVSEMEGMKMQFSQMQAFLCAMCSSQGLTVPSFLHMDGSSSSGSGASSSGSGASSLGSSSSR